MKALNALPPLREATPRDARRPRPAPERASRSLGLSMALTEIGEAAVRGERLPALFRLAVNWVGEALGAEATRVYQSARGEIRLVAGHGDGPHPRQAAGPSSFEAFALAQGASVAFGGRDAEGRFDHRPLAAQGLASGIAVPVRGREEPLALLTIHWRSDAPPAGTDLRFAEAVARILSAAAERHRAEDELRARERRARALLESVDSALFTVDDRGAVAWANGAAATLLGVGRLGLAGIQLASLFSGLSSEPGGATFLEELRQTGRLQGTVTVQRAGRSRTLQFEALAEVDAGLHAVCLRDAAPPPAGRPNPARGHALLGALAAGLAHEFNNPLACVKANLHYVAGRLRRAGDAEGLDAVDDAVAGAERLVGLVAALRPFAGPAESPSRPVALQEVLESCVALASGALRSRARLACEFAEVPPVMGPAPELAQALLALLFRAAQAIEEGGVREHEIRLGLHLDEGGRVEVSLRDTGRPLSPDEEAMISGALSPEASCPAGLALARQLVTGSGGKLSVEAAPGGGTVVRVLLRTAPGWRGR